MSARLIYTPLEADVLVSYVTHFPEHAAIMGAQLAMAVPTGRGLGPIGFAIGFEVHDVPLFEADVDLSLSGDIDGLAAPAVFVLTVRDGRVAFLQGFTSDQSPWPEQITGFRVYRDTPSPNDGAALAVAVTLKLATSLDGRIATGAGESRWITGEAAREAVHRLRARHDAVVIGVETALADDPELTVRLPGHRTPQPARVVLDSRQRLAPDCRLVRTAREIPTYLVSVTPPDRALVDAGVRILQVPAVGEDRPDLKMVVQALEKEGLHRLFVEGGGQVAASFLRCELVDALEWFRAPMVIGGEGRPAVGALAVLALAAAPRFKRTEVVPLGDDLWERYERI